MNENGNSDIVKAGKGAIAIGDRIRRARQRYPAVIAVVVLLGALIGSLAREVPCPVGQP